MSFGIEHLLLGPICEGDGIAASVLEQQGANLEDARGGPAAAGQQRRVSGSG